MPTMTKSGKPRTKSAVIGEISTMTGLTRKEVSSVFQSMANLIKKDLGKKGHVRWNSFQKNLVDGKPNKWRCRAGARYLYICEDGLVHYCSQQRGYPGVPLTSYTKEDIRREYLTKKACAPYCTIACVHQVATFDNWRDPQTLAVKGAVQRESVQAIKIYQIEQTEKA